MDRILIILKKENGPKASSAPALGLNTIIFKYVYWYMKQVSQVSVYRTIGPLVFQAEMKSQLNSLLNILISKFTSGQSFSSSSQTFIKQRRIKSYRVWAHPLQFCSEATLLRRNGNF